MFYKGHTSKVCSFCMFCHFSVLCSACLVFSRFHSNTQNLFQLLVMTWLPFMLALGGAVFFQLYTHNFFKLTEEIGR